MLLLEIPQNNSVLILIYAPHSMRLAVQMIYPDHLNGALLPQSVCNGNTSTK